MTERRKETEREAKTVPKTKDKETISLKRQTNEFNNSGETDHMQ